MIAEGRSLEEAAEAMEMPTVHAKPYLRSALAERESKTSETRPGRAGGSSLPPRAVGDFEQ